MLQKIVTVNVILLNILFVAILANTELMSPFWQIIVALPISIINMTSIWWLGLGGRFRR
jgi:hypothetical protein